MAKVQSVCPPTFLRLLLDQFQALLTRSGRGARRLISSTFAAASSGASVPGSHAQQNLDRLGADASADEPAPNASPAGWT